MANTYIRYNMDIREYARDTMLEAKLKVIKKAMEPINPTEKKPFPSNAFHQWHESVKKNENVDDLIHQRFMEVISPGTSTGRYNCKTYNHSAQPRTS